MRILKIALSVLLILGVVSLGGEAEANWVSIRAIDKDITVEVASYPAKLDSYRTVHFSQGSPFNITIGRNNYLIGNTSCLQGETKVNIKPVFRITESGTIEPKELGNYSGSNVTNYTITVIAYYDNGRTTTRTVTCSDSSGGNFSIPETNNGGRLININAYITGTMTFYISYYDPALTLCIDVNIKSSEGIPLTVSVPEISEIQAQLNNSVYGLSALNTQINELKNNSVSKDDITNLQNAINNIQSSMAPTITKVNGVNNSTATKTGTITIEISSSNATEYRARDKAGIWSEWTTSNTIPVSLSSKGVRTIEVQARSGGEGSAVANYTMTVFSL